MGAPRSKIEDIRISPSARVSDWKALHMGPTSTNAAWKKAVKIFHDRIDARFLAPVEAMRKHKEWAVREFCGFTVLAIDCLLIETLGQFYNGFNETPSMKEKDKALNPRGKRHHWFYAEFMKQMMSLSNANGFDTRRKRELFYSHFRCGILHQAQTKRKSRVVYKDKAEMVTSPEMVTFADDSDQDQGLIVDRNQLHNALVVEVTSYENLLLSPQSQAHELKRKNFITKMNFIAP